MPTGSRYSDDTRADVNNFSLYILNLQPALYDKFLTEARLSEDVEVKVYKTFPSFFKGLQSANGGCANLLLFLPSGKLDPAKTRQLRLTMIESPLYIVTGECDERA